VIANAVANALAALGVEPRELPLSPSRIWHLARDARERQAAVVAPGAAGA
jgi:carbon-monoxide dehydrogenase large subunit